MKTLAQALRSARFIEIFVLVALLCVALVVALNAQTPRADDAATQDELRLERLLGEIEGAGHVTVMIARDESGAALGAVVAAGGAGNVRVALRLEQAVHTLLGLELERIEIVEADGGLE